MKLPEWVERVEVWSNVVFFIGEGRMGNITRRSGGLIVKSAFTDRLEPVLDLLIQPKDKDDGTVALVKFSLEEFEKIMEGVDYEMP